EIDLDDFTGVDPAVFKEIGQGRGGAQVLRTRESLMANLGPIRPGIHTGDRLEVHARVRAEYVSTSDADAVPSLHVGWADQERRLSPGESWLRRDLTYVVTTEDTERGYAEVSCAVVIDGGELQARLRVPAQSHTSRGRARRPRRGGPDQAGWAADRAADRAGGNSGRCRHGVDSERARPGRGTVEEERELLPEALGVGRTGITGSLREARGDCLLVLARPHPPRVLRICDLHGRSDERAQRWHTLLGWRDFEGGEQPLPRRQVHPVEDLRHRVGVATAQVGSD